MKKYILCSLFFLMITGSNLFSQNISYIQPDIGAPGMSIYVEIIGPFDDYNNFGPDGFYMNNLGDNVYVTVADPADADKIVVGPLTVSWEGRMISTHIFIKPNANLHPNSWEWDKLNPEFKILLNIHVDGNSTPAAQQPVFYIVQPCPGGDKSANASREFGDVDNLGKRSPRGAILFDSLTLANETYTVSTSDCDPNTDGNQGYLPFILMAKHYIRGGGNTRISADGLSAKDGHGGTGGPGGGGGGGKFCDHGLGGSPSPDDGGSGYTSGGNGGINKYTGGGSYSDLGEGSGIAGKGLNGVLPAETTINWEASGGGTGHPFGLSGKFTVSGSTDQPEGAYGGGSGYRNNKPGGAGGYGTRGSNATGQTGDESGGYAHGNIMVVPIAGGSGSASGNPQETFSGCSGSGGGGGGAVAVFAPELNGLVLSAVGGNGNQGSGIRTGGGSGGFTGMFAKLPVDKIDFYLHGGNSSTDRSGGVGRARSDIPTFAGSSVQPNNEVPEFRGPTIDTSHFVFREHSLLGSRGVDQDIDLYIRSESGNWELIDSIFYPSSTEWMTELTLDPLDSLFYVVAVQVNEDPGTDEYLLEPEKVHSFAAANILTVMTTPDIDG
ncbi:MAG: hypothetical protein KAH48_03955, partial [Chlorobi bacterium]|nr:hypothetical protein [Chlorobiota bacterium]